MKKSLAKEISNYKILACMPVRATGSTHGIHPRRCLWDICGKPVIQWALEPVIKCKYIDRIVVCTEDRKIKDVVEGLGVMVIDRPLYQAHPFPRDYTSGLFRRFRTRALSQQASLVYTETMEYVLYWLDEQEKYTPDIFVMLQANFPLGTLNTLNKVIEAFFEDEEATEAKTFYRVSHLLWMDNPTMSRKMTLFDLIPLDRQLYPPIYGAGPFLVFGHPKRVSSQGRRIAAVDIKPEEGLDLHTQEDLFLARCYMKRRLEKERRSKDEEGSVDCTGADPDDGASGSPGFTNWGK